MAYATIATEGGLFPAGLLEQIARGEAEGQRPTDFGLDSRARLTDAIQSSFSDVNAYWRAFTRRRAHSRESLTTLTRASWVIPLLESLDYTPIGQRAAAQAGSDTYFISHRAGDAPDAPPVHIVAADQNLDRRPQGSRRSPYALVQEYLNRADAVWGLVTNGEHLRLLRASNRLTGPAYLQFDLPAMVEGNQYGEFALLYRILHRSRLPRSSADAAECLLERYYQHGIEQGGRVRDRLRDGVEAALKELGTGFLSHPGSEELRQAMQSGRLTVEDYYRQLLRLVYRLLFLFVVEERRLMFDPQAPESARPEIYIDYYSVGRLRERCERYFDDDEYSDLWPGLVQTFRFFRFADQARFLGLTALDGELFGGDACRDLEGAQCSNRALLSALRSLSTFTEKGIPRRVNYAGLDVEELGSVYESLLDYRPYVEIGGVPACHSERSEESRPSAGRDSSLPRRPFGPRDLRAALPHLRAALPQNGIAPHFDLLAGSERKQTGSYYTPPELVHELIESALVPVMRERLAAASTPAEKEQALLGLRVCDPASGSGHFLLAAARRLGYELARIRAGEDEPPIDEYRHARRDVIRQCLYAVDKNPLAVDLCKVALWLEGHQPGLPLSFLDHHIKCGDSLIGVFDLKVLDKGIPDDAYTPVTGDDKQAAAYYKRRNKAERSGQLSLDNAASQPISTAGLAADFGALGTLDDRTPDDVRAKEEVYGSLRQSQEWRDLKTACDLWAAAFFVPLRLPEGHQPHLVPTTDTIRQFRSRPGAALGPLVGQATEQALRHRFFHWPLEFPDVFAHGGFDVVLGNPPFSAQLPTSAIDLLASVGFSRSNSNSAALFVQQTLRILSVRGGLGLICPKSITFSSRWTDIRQLLEPYLIAIYDCGQAWQNVLLEQVIFTASKWTGSDHFLAGKFQGQEVRVSGTVPRSLLRQYGLVPCDVERLTLDLVQRIAQSSFPLGNLCRTTRGYPLQGTLNEQGRLPVIGGKDIGRYRIKSYSGFLSSEHIHSGSPNLESSPKVVYQNIVAHVTRPAPHIKIMACLDETGVVTLDTVNNLRLRDERVDLAAIVALLNSKVFNWLAWRLLYNKAIRTMHLDQYFLDRMPVPSSFLQFQDRLTSLVRCIQEELVGQAVVLHRLPSLLYEADELISDCYGLNDRERETVLADFPDIDV